MSNYFICTRNVKGRGNRVQFGNEPGEATFLVVPEDNTSLSPSYKQPTQKAWLAKLLAGRELKDILIYIHGYNMDMENVVQRHKILKAGLQQNGWNGELVTFVWPSNTEPLLYLEDRHDAKRVSMELVSKGMRFFEQQVLDGCRINVHVIAHSTGAFILRESFTDSIKTAYASDNWTASQIIFIGGDIASSSMEGMMGTPVYNRCVRFTNYFSNYDSILGLSGVKRLGLENRVGRVGLPMGSPEKAVDVNCSEYYEKYKDSIQVENAAHSHSWHFWSKEFFKDLVYTLKGEMDRHVIPTRELRSDGELYLKT
ncbi:MAG: alpha/beta hydrolase [Bacteroidota bacterium]|nr:alpha/beta hydrolase [Bacteroidota bacterium]